MNELSVIMASIIGFLPMFMFVVIYSFYKTKNGKKENNKNEMANGYIGLLIFISGLVVSAIFIKKQ